MRIPPVLHQTWKDPFVPEPFDRMARSWRDRHKDWEYVLWTDEMNRQFIHDHFPAFLPVYDGYETNIQRVDAARYFVLYRLGGFFIDMDFECLANIEPLLGDSCCIFGKEPPEHCAIHNKDLIISNAFMGVVPGFPFFELLCRELMEVRYSTDHPNDRVLESTGPFMLSRLYKNYERKEDISLWEPELIYPFTKEELSALTGGLQNDSMHDKLKKAYGIHHYAGTWWKKHEHP
jgi:mannosyltransferase OCH1-like enzyme